MKQIELPDGTIGEFPDSMSDDDIKAVLRRKFPPAAPESDTSKNLRADLSAMTQNPARAQYDAMPGWQKPIVAANDVLQLTADGATMGWGDKAVAAARSPFTGKSYDAELADARRKTEGARRRAGGAGVAAELAGGVGTALGAAGSGATLAGRLGTAAMPGVTGLAARSALMGVEGAGYGAASAAGHDTNVTEGALIGAGSGAVGNVIGETVSGIVGKVADKFNKKPKMITADEYKAMGRRAYQEAEDAGVAFNNLGVRRLRDNVVADLTDLGYDPSLAPGVVPFLKRVDQQYKRGNVTLKGLDTWRKVAANGYIPGNKTNNMMVSKVLDHIDELMKASDPDTILMGSDPQRAAMLLDKARKFWSSARKLETVDTLVRRGEIIGGSQANQDVAGATKRQLRGILLNEGKSRGFTPDELQGMEKAVVGTPTTHALDLVSGLFPSSKLGAAVQGSIAGSSVLSGNVPGLALQGAGLATGYAAKKLSESATKRSVNDLANIIARGGYRVPAVQNAVQRLAKSERDTLSRLLMTMGIQFGTAPAEANP